MVLVLARTFEDLGVKFVTFRVEEKIVVTRMQALQRLGYLLENGAEYLFPNRRVTSCYFDTRDYRVFHESEEGVLPRRKVRIRNYNNEDQYFLETKTSSIEGRFKNGQKLDRLVAKKNMSSHMFDNLLGNIMPVVSVSYKRCYVSINNLRITIDTDIRYQNLRKSCSFAEKFCVIEIKAAVDQPTESINHFLPMQRGRFSKYCRAINAVKPHGLLLQRG